MNFKDIWYDSPQRGQFQNVGKVVPVRESVSCTWGIGILRFLHSEMESQKVCQIQYLVGKVGKL